MSGGLLWRAKLAAVGPGMLFAGAAIGVSHLVQSTRAGATYGFDLLWAVLLVLICKYPFFEYAHRYTAATGESLLVGYARLGRWALGLFMLVVLVSSFITTAAVVVVTAGLVSNLLGWTVSLAVVSAGLLGGTLVLLGVGHYRMLDRGMKIMVLALAVMTVVAVAMAFGHSQVPVDAGTAPCVWTAGGLTFLLALMGWMPAPLEISVWSSLWVLERDRAAAGRMSVAGSKFDFQLGYVVTGMLALAFLSFGALIMFGGGEHFSSSAIVFSRQLVDMYALALGDWSRLLISLVAFMTMFSTTITVVDGYSRTLDRGLAQLFGLDGHSRRMLYALLLAVGALVIIGLFLRSMKSLVDVVTVLAFLTAPLVAALNFKVVMAPWVPIEHRPGRMLRFLSWCGLLFLVGFSVAWVVVRWLL